ncbi:hypothetical protein Gorai_014002 [Gossypium raimondii]|uniref:Uncharacterized protein n=1 Tax=Gossypium raimondii TaxID=29730 RepID=A0A7J8P1L9_GOSRA|nr:hypothetical protein [Gossypium raimondii]
MKEKISRKSFLSVLKNIRGKQKNVKAGIVQVFQAPILPVKKKNYFF